MKKNTIRGMVVAALMGISALLPGVVPTSSAQEQGAQMVTFGDSFTANGGSDPARTTPPSAEWLPHCRTDNNNWAKVAARALNKSIADYSCNGTFGIPLAIYLDAAIQKGDLGPATEDVVLMIGGLDPLFYGDVVTNLTKRPELLGTPFQEAMRLLQNRVREVAPKARLTFATYPRLTDNDQVCPTFGQVLPAPGATIIESGINETVRNISQALGAHFVDVYAASAGHSPCAVPEERWTAIIPDPVAPSVMGSHPTDLGHLEMGKIMTDGLR